MVLLDGLLSLPNACNTSLREGEDKHQKQSGLLGYCIRELRMNQETTA